MVILKKRRFWQRAKSMTLGILMTAIASAPAFAQYKANDVCFQQWSYKYPYDFNQIEQLQGNGKEIFIVIKTDGKLKPENIKNNPSSVIMESDCNDHFVYKTLEEFRTKGKINEIALKINIKTGEITEIYNNAGENLLENDNIK